MNKQDFLVTPDLYASKGNRFVNYIIDVVIFIALFLGLVIVVSYLFYTLSDDVSAVDNFIYELENINPFLDRLITSIMIAILYFTTETVLKGRTIAKYITKTKVVLQDGSNPKALDYLKRSFSRIIPFEAFSFLGSEGRGWHDTISNTYVVDLAKFEAKKKAQSELDQIGVYQDT